MQQVVTHGKTVIIIIDDYVALQLKKELQKTHRWSNILENTELDKFIKELVDKLDNS